MSILGGCSGIPKSQNRLVYGYEAVWKEGIQRCSPSYPKTSLSQAKEGLAVTEIQFDRSGKARSVRLIQSPDVEIGRAAQACASLWTVPTTLDDELSREGKLYFYFLIRGGEGHVYLANNPDDRKTLLAMGSGFLK